MSEVRWVLKRCVCVCVLDDGHRLLEILPSSDSANWYEELMGGEERGTWQTDQRLAPSAALLKSIIGENWLLKIELKKSVSLSAKHNAVEYIW